MRRFRAALLALGLLLSAAGVSVGLVAQRATEERDGSLRLAAASRSAALEDYTGRARAVALVSARSAAFAAFYHAPGSRRDRIAGRAGGDELMPRVNAALKDLELLFPDSLAGSAFVDRSGAENAAVVQGHVVDPADLAADVRQAPWFDAAFALPYGTVFQSRPYRSPATGEWVIGVAAKVDAGPGVSPALVAFELTVESIRLAVYDETPDHWVRVVDLLDGRVVIDSTKPQFVDTPLGNPDDLLLRWVQTAPDGTVASRNAMRHVVHHLGAKTNIATAWAVVVSSSEPSRVWVGPAGVGPVAVLAVGLLLLVLSVAGYLRHGRVMHRTARRDELTGLHNRLSARETADALLGRGRGLSVLLVDLDRFKHVNDSLGHHAGDHLLAEVAARLAEVVREPEDVVARLGGDEFVVLTGRLTDERALRALCERLLAAITAPVDINGLDVTVGASIGIAVGPEHGSDYGTLLQHADIAMYDAKSRRVGWELYRPGLVPHERVDLALDADLRAAVHTGQLELVVQPTFVLHDGTARGVECLVRWRHPTRGLLAPGQFIPYAEATGTIKLITRSVLAMALDQAARWRGTGLTVAVNVSAHDVMDPGFARHVLDSLAQRRLPGTCLEIELTETALLTDPHAAATVLRMLRDAGVSVAIDDFGSGYASLPYLRRFPVSTLKLDRSLVQGLLSDPADHALVKWTIEMAHALGMVCVAEGVEEPETLAALRDMGCDEAQGYLLQRPVPVEELDLDATGSALRPV